MYMLFLGTRADLRLFMDIFFPTKYAGSVIGKKFFGNSNLNKGWSTTQVL